MNEINEIPEDQSYTMMDQAREITAQCWCDPRASNREMDVVLAEAIAEQISHWIVMASQNQANTDYYRGLLIKCGETIGDRAYTCDDGSRSKNVLCAKIPDIIADDYVNGGG